MARHRWTLVEIQDEIKEWGDKAPAMAYYAKQEIRRRCGERPEAEPLRLPILRFDPQTPRLPVVRKSPDTTKDGYIYVIREVGGKCKIGAAKNVQTRLATLQTGSHDPLELVLSIPTTGRYVLEALLHRRFASQRLTGEWFDLTQDDIAWIAGLPSS